MGKESIKIQLEKKVLVYNRPFFIDDDPISIPHRFTLQQDIEIAGFFSAILAWGNRKSILKSGSELMQRMDNHPYEFCIGHSSKELKQLLGFKHRTFNDTDLLGLVAFFKRHYTVNKSLESAFSQWMKTNDLTIESGLIGFHNYVFSEPDFFESRTRKHISTPSKKSACKRLNMYLRWMVRNDQKGVDFGIWKNIQPSQLVCPLDIHVSRVARQLGLLKRNQNDWESAIELTEALRILDPADPVKYDFALFSMGVNKAEGFTL